MITRKIVSIDEEKCNGCGLCVPQCHEGAIQIIDGKARLVKEKYCDGLGACLGHCPQNAITIEERSADEFNENAVKEHLKTLSKSTDSKTGKSPEEGSIANKKTHTQPHASGGCPSAQILNLKKETPDVSPDNKTGNNGHRPSQLGQWPVQLSLVPPDAPFLQDADLLITADCVPFAYADYHKDFLKDKALVIGCPKLDDVGFYKEKLTEMFRVSGIKSITVLHMEVPCCFGIVTATKQALADSGKDIPFTEETITIRGERK